MLRFDLGSSALLPFERNYYLLPENSTDHSQESKNICGFVQREKIEEVEERGMPDYLLFREDKILFLK